MPTTVKNKFGTISTMGSNPLAVDASGKPLQQELQGQKQLSSGEAGTIGGTGGPTVGAPSSSPTAPKFSNIQKYMTANKDFNKAGGGMAGMVTDKVKSVAGQASGDVNTAKNQFNNAATAGRVAYDDATANAVADSATVQAATATTPQVQQWNRMRDGSYAGPQALGEAAGSKSVAALDSSIQDAAKLANSARDQSRRFSLLQNMFGKAGYSKGQQKLDAAMIGSSSDSLSKLNEGRAAAVQASRDLREAQNYADVQAIQNKQEAKNTNQKIRELLGTKAGQFQGQMQQRAADYNTEKDDMYKAALADAKQGRLDPKLIKALQDAKVNLNELYNVDLSKYLNKDAGKADQYNIVTDEDKARTQALRALAGSRIGEIYPLSELNKYDTGSNNFVFDPVSGMKISEFATAVKKAKDDYTTKLSDPDKRLKESTGRLEGDYGLKNKLAVIAKYLRDNPVAVNPMLNPNFDAKAEKAKIDKMSDRDLIKANLSRVKEFAKIAETNDRFRKNAASDVIAGHWLDAARANKDFGTWLLENLDFEQNKATTAQNDVNKLNELYTPTRKIESTIGKR